MTLGMDVERYLVIGDPLMGKLPDEMSAIGPPNSHPNFVAKDVA